MKYNTERIVYNQELGVHMLGEFVFDLRGLYAYLETLTDQRDSRGIRYGLADAFFYRTFLIYPSQSERELQIIVEKMI
jgi:hypothetical protein